MLVEEAVVPEVFDRTVQNMASFSHVNNILIASTRMEYPQWQFDILIGIFEWVVLQTNMGKTDGMVCQTFHIYGQHYDAT